MNVPGPWDWVGDMPAVGWSWLAAIAAGMVAGPIWIWWQSRRGRW